MPGGLSLDALTRITNVHWRGSKGFISASGRWQVSGVNGYFLDEKGSVIGEIPTHGYFTGTPYPFSAEAASCALGAGGNVGYAGYTQDARVPPDISSPQVDLGPAVWSVPLAAGSPGWSSITVGTGWTLFPVSISSYKEGVFAAYTEQESADPTNIFNTLAHFSLAGDLLWTESLGASIATFVNCAANSDGTVVVAYFSGSWSMTAYSKEGVQLWTKSSLGGPEGSTMLSQTATAGAFVYARSNDGPVIKANIATGEAIWTTPVANVVGVDIASDGSVYACRDDGLTTRLTRLDSDTGAPSWTITVASDGEQGGAAASTARCVAAPGKIVAVGHVNASSEFTASTVYAYEQSTGAPAWTKLYGTRVVGEANAGQQLSALGRSPGD